MSVIYTLQLTGSQKMALTDVLLELIRIPDSTQTFIDCSQDPPVETTVTELLRLVTEAKTPTNAHEWKERKKR